MKRKVSLAQKQRTHTAAAAAVLFVLSACAGDPIPSRRTPTEDFADAESELAPGFKLALKHTHFFSLTSPHPSGNSCAGDAKLYFHPFQLQTPNATVLSSAVDPTTYTGPDAFAAAIGTEQDVPFPEDALNNNISYRPSFLKNVAVDLTDANSASEQNLSISCSLAATPSSPPPSNCATFDYGAIGGVPTDMGGTLLLAGGVNGQNYAGYRSANSTFQGPALSCGVNGPSQSTECRSDVFALKVDALPAAAGGTTHAPGAEGATEPISMFTKIISSDTSSSAAAFQAVAGASAAYNGALKRVLVFGGSVSTGAGGFDTDLTQVFDVTTQKWLSQSAPTKVVPTSMTTIFDSGTGPTGTAGTYTPTVYNISKLPGAKAEFGYAAIPYSAAHVASLDGDFDDPASDPTDYEADTTDRIFIAGGTSSTEGSAQSVYRLNPTFGPEVADISNYNVAPSGHSAVRVLQWPDSSPVTIMSHIGPTGSMLLALQSSPTGPTTPATAAGSVWNAPGRPSKITNFGMAPAVTTLTPNGARRGVAVITAGFDQAYNKTGNGYPDATLTHSLSSGVLAVLAPTGSSVGPALPYASIGEALGVPTSRDEGYRLLPLHLRQVSGASIPWLGGASLVPGSTLTSNAADLLFIGGSRCRGYVSDTSLVSADNCFSSSYDPNRRLEIDLSSGAFPFSDITGGAMTIPDRAGMAIARGMYNGTPIVLAFGGSDNISGLNTAHANTRVYGWNAANPLWVQAGSTSPTPPSLTDATLVYSHVTGKFYLYGGIVTGGFSGSTTIPSDSAPRSELWELTVSNFVGATLSVSWRRLNPTCYPSCPTARKSHRMVEVNYNNLDPENEPVCTDAGAPCSFGLFMEGGSADVLGLTLLGDRWMFDPTANPPSSSSGGGPEGHWQRVDIMPQRRHAAMASYSYTLPFSGQQIHRALMFGGETALSNPSRGIDGDYFVAPTLGDTIMYDFQNNTWTRVRLLGQGASAAATWLSSASRFDLIQTYRLSAAAPFTLQGWVSGTTEFMTNPNLRHFTPPPLAGATMVVRAFPRAIGSSGQAQTPLAIPEVFMFGGRKKDGKFSSLGHVWKFCTASPGERPASSTSDSNDYAQCDAYDSATNYDSVSPTAEITGRWLYKIPQVTPYGAGSETAEPTDTHAFAGSYLGAGTYDPVRDRILLLGGLAPTGAVELATTSGTQLTGYNTILEYTAPSKTRPSGTLNATTYQTSSEVNGSWREVRNCPRTDGLEPAARFGHSLSYDALNSQVILVGGQRAIEADTTDYQGKPLTQEVTLGGTLVEIPEVWTGRYVESDLATSDPDYALIDRSGGTPGPCYLWKQKTTFGNTQYIESMQPLEGSVTFAASTFIPSGGYNTGYYSMFDSACGKQGPINTTDTSVNKLLAGGVYIDIDRSRMSATENLILNLTFIALGPDHQRPDGARFDLSEAASLKVHLVRTGLDLDSIQSTLQPRHLTYSSLETYPQIVDTLAVLAPPASGLRQEQIVLPVSANSGIDRIRIERYSGSAILIDATVFRTQRATAGGSD
jgi:hypothetical protein